MNKKLLWSIFLTMGLFLLSGLTLAAGDATAGKDKASACTSCHGVDGKGSEPNTNIAGMNVGKFKTAMNAYKSGERNNAMMQMFAKKLNDQDIEDLAAYYASLK